MAITFDPSVGSPSKFYRTFADAVFLEVEVESLLDDAEVSSPAIRVPVRNGITFDPTVGSPSKFYRCFRTPFS